MEWLEQQYILAQTIPFIWTGFLYVPVTHPSDLTPTCASAHPYLHPYICIHTTLHVARYLPGRVHKVWLSFRGAHHPIPSAVLGPHPREGVNDFGGVEARNQLGALVHDVGHDRGLGLPSRLCV